MQMKQQPSIKLTIKDKDWNQNELVLKDCCPLLFGLVFMPSCVWACVRIGMHVCVRQRERNIDL
jgi:hypothetical protein